MHTDTTQCLTHNLCDLHEAGFRTLNISKDKSRFGQGVQKTDFACNYRYQVYVDSFNS